jgi:chromosome segregation ATPase
MRHALLLLFIIVMTALVGTSAFAQSETDRLRDALRVSTAQTRALEDQRVTLQARVTEAERDRSVLKGELETAKSQAVQADKDYRDAVKDFNARLEDHNKTLDKWKDAYAEAASVAQTKDAERAKFEAEFNAYKARTTSCEAKNAHLIEINTDIAAAYRDLGGIKKFTTTEPFVGIDNVDRQNKVQDFIDKTLEQRAQP